MNRIFVLLDKLRINSIKVAGALSLLIMVCIIFIGIFFRYILHSSLIWTDELASYIFIWNIYIGVILASRSDMHTKIDFIINLFPEKVRLFIVYFNKIVIIFLYVLLCYLGIETMRTFSIVKTVTTKISWAFIYLTVPIAFGLSFLDEIVGLIKQRSMKK